MMLLLSLRQMMVMMMMVVLFIGMLFMGSANGCVLTWRVPSIGQSQHLGIGNQLILIDMAREFVTRTLYDRCRLRLPPLQGMDMETTFDLTPSCRDLFRLHSPNMTLIEREIDTSLDEMIRLYGRESIAMVERPTLYIVPYVDLWHDFIGYHWNTFEQSTTTMRCFATPHTNTMLTEILAQQSIYTIGMHDRRSLDFEHHCSQFWPQFLPRFWWFHCLPPDDAYATEIRDILSSSRGSSSINVSIFAARKMGKPRPWLDSDHHALLDLFILIRSRWFIGNYHSSYSRFVAMARGNDPQIRWLTKRWFSIPLQQIALATWWITSLLLITLSTKPTIRLLIITLILFIYGPIQPFPPLIIRLTHTFQHLYWSS